MRKPAEAHALSDLKSFGFVTESGNGTNDFMTGNQRVFSYTKVVVEHCEVRVTDATMRDFDLNFLRPKFAGIETERLELPFSRVGCVSMKLVHKYDSVDEGGLFGMEKSEQNFVKQIPYHASVVRCIYHSPRQLRIESSDKVSVRNFGPTDFRSREGPGTRLGGFSA